jgi:ATP-dependent Lon protease
MKVEIHQLMFEFGKKRIVSDDDEDIVLESNEFLPLFSKKEEDEINKSNLPNELPILAIKNTVLFPGVVMPITIGRDKSIQLVKDVMKGDKIIGVMAQKDPKNEEPEPQDMHEIGTMAEILKKMSMPDGSVTIIIQGKKRIKVTEYTAQEPYMKAKVVEAKTRQPAKDKLDELNATIESLRDVSQQIVEISPNIPSEAAVALKNIDSPSFLIHFISSNLNVSSAEKQLILETTDLAERAHMVLQAVSKELQMLQLKYKIQDKVRTDIDKQQREYFLQQQMRAIQEELGADSPDLEIVNLRKKGAKKKWPEEAAKQFNKELDRLMRINPASPDYSVGLNYVQLMLDLPWSNYSKDNFDLKRAKKILDHDHYGLEKIKKRILEYLAVLKLKGDMKSPIICLYGPPGVGKTSLGKSIASSLGRKYIRMSLGGMHDESEIRGHRKTYIGAMPGRIIQNLKKVGTSNPVFVLDEIDKLASDFRGDPSSALLEVLDPEQNSTFYDNYLEMDYDLSKVLFVATANSLQTIQPALMDRMEIIEITGYSLEEKLEIAKKYLLPKQRKAHGLTASQIKISQAALEEIIFEYTRESGVRGLDKKIASVARYVATQIAMEDAKSVSVNLSMLEEILGVEKLEAENYENNDKAGVAVGLAWSPMGGSVLYVESQLSRGKGLFQVTGQLGDVMKESVSLARSFIKSHADYLRIDSEVFNHWDLHVHFPAGAIPKDGPSAGITVLTALASLYSQRKIKAKLAFTGEITLRGKVLPVGGIKEKILAAKRAGIETIVMCKSNQKDVEDVKPDYIEGLSFYYVEDMLDVLDYALTDEKVDNPIDVNAPLKELKKKKKKEKN